MDYFTLTINGEKIGVFLHPLTKHVLTSWDIVLGDRSEAEAWVARMNAEASAKAVRVLKRVLGGLFGTANMRGVQSFFFFKAYFLKGSIQGKGMMF